MPVDLIRRCSARGRAPSPVLFIPGAFAGAWMWEETFLPYFAAEGFDAYAMSFRAHGQQGWPLHSLGLKDFVSDLARVIDALPAPPVLVGHSLGGLVAYEYAREDRVPAVVLFSAVPPDGTVRSFGALAGRHPVSAVKMAAMSLFPTIRMLGEPPVGVYSDRVPKARARAFTRRLRPESWRVLGEVFSRPRDAVAPLDVPTYVVGTSGDHLIPASEVRRTAGMLDAPCRIFDGFSHTPFVEPDWEIIAAELVRWLRETLEPSAAGARRRRA